MKKKSLRQLGRELGVSHAYLSQVRNGKKQPSAELVTRLMASGNPLSCLESDFKSVAFACFATPAGCDHCSQQACHRQEHRSATAPRIMYNPPQ